MLVVSERPGDNEDREGRAFVGRSGALLDKILHSIGIDPDRDTLITNIVKCKPEIDRAPTSDEATACLPFLEKQIALVRPRVVLLLGHVALKWIDPAHKDFKMEDEAGRLFELGRYPGVHFMVLYHPAFLLRDPSKKAPPGSTCSVSRHSWRSKPAADPTLSAALCSAWVHCLLDPVHIRAHSRIHVGDLIRPRPHVSFSRR